MGGIDVQLFFTPKDEREFSEAILASFPKVVFIDGPTSLHSDPTLRTTLDLSQTGMVEIWNRQIYPFWPKSLAEPGTVTGPDVILFQRSRNLNYVTPSGKEFDALTSGCVSWGGG